MNTEQFFDLPEEERDKLFALHVERKQIRQTKLQIAEAQQQLDTRTLNNQMKCKHPAVVVTHRGNTGNYDPGQDSYWDEFQCPDCGKYWTEDRP